MEAATILDATEARVARSVAVSMAAQLAARGVDLLVNVGVSVAILRELGPSRYGDYVLVATVVGIVGLGAELGLPKLSVREVARDPDAAGPIVGTVTVLRVGLSVAAAAAAQLVLLALGASADVRVAALVASSMFVAEALLSVVVVFHVAMRQHYEAAVRLGANLVKLAVVAVLVAEGAGLVSLVAATTTTLLTASLLAWAIARFRLGLRPSWDGDRVASLLRAALPVWPAMLAGVLYLKLDALVVAVLASREDVGIYGAAYQPIEYLLLGSAVILHVLFPVAARSYERDPARFVRTYQRGTQLVLAVLLPVATAVLLHADPLVTAAYEERFADAAGPMAVLAVALVFLTINAWQGLVLLAADRPTLNVRCLAVGIAVNVALDLVLVPWLGPLGAAWGTLVSAVVVVMLSTRAVATAACATLDHGELARVAGAAVGLAAELVALRAIGVHWLPATALGAASYPLLLSICGVVRSADVRAVLHDRDDVPVPLVEARS